MTLQFDGNWWEDENFPEDMRNDVVFLTENIDISDILITKQFNPSVQDFVFEALRKTELKKIKLKNNRLSVLFTHSRCITESGVNYRFQHSRKLENLMRGIWEDGLYEAFGCIHLEDLDKVIIIPRLERLQRYPYVSYKLQIKWWEKPNESI